MSGSFPISSKEPCFSPFQYSYRYTEHSPCLWHSGQSPEETPSVARHSQGSALPKVQKSSVSTPSLNTSQPPRGPGTEPYSGQTPSLSLPTGLQRRPMSLFLPQANLPSQATRAIFYQEGNETESETRGKGRVWERVRRQTWSLMTHSLSWLCLSRPPTNRL